MAAKVPIKVEEINKQSDKYLPNTWYVQDPKNKSWVVIEIIKAYKGMEGSISIYEYSYYKVLVESGRSGGVLNTSLIGTDTVRVGVGASLQVQAVKGKNYKEALKQLEEIRASGTGIGERPTTPPPTTESPVFDNFPVLPTELNQVQWNPRPHAITRPPSFYTLANIKSSFKDKGDDLRVSKNAEPGVITAAIAAQKRLEKQTKKGYYNLGKIYQNKTSAAALNALGDVKPEDVKADQLYGFRFIYNPNKIRYGTTMETSIDWQAQTQSAANFFSGNTVVEFTLYLNRIIDMTTLNDPNSDLTLYYPGGISDVEKKNILKRGTEYDLDFLYRCVNGKPANTTLLTEADLETSDFGYITGMPVWLQLHENMRYRGSIAKLDVEHVIFTESMVPVLSIVTISLLRYPELDKLTKSQRNKIEALQQELASKSDTPNEKVP